MKPTAKPSAMEKLNGMTMIVRKQGMDSAGSDQLIPLTFPAMSTPTTTKVAAVANPGMAENKGTKKIADANRVRISLVSRLSLGFCKVGQVSFGYYGHHKTKSAKLSP